MTQQLTQQTKDRRKYKLIAFKLHVVSHLQHQLDPVVSDTTRRSAVLSFPPLTTLLKKKNSKDRKRVSFQNSQKKEQQVKNVMFKSSTFYTEKQHFKSNYFKKKVFIYRQVIKTSDYSVFHNQTGETLQLFTVQRPNFKIHHSFLTLS